MEVDRKMKETSDCAHKDEKQMNVHYSDNRKIDPSQGARLGDGTENDGNRIEIGPTALAHAEWLEAGLALPDLAEMRKARHKRRTDARVARG